MKFLQHKQFEHYLNNIITEQEKYGDKMKVRQSFKHRKIFIDFIKTELEAREREAFEAGKMLFIEKKSKEFDGILFDEYTYEDWKKNA